MITTNSITEYIIKNRKRKNLHWKYDGTLWFSHDNKWYHESEIDKYYPIYQYEKFNNKGENPDKTKIK
jgi:hypothetical protein